MASQERLEGMEMVWRGWVGVVDRWERDARGRGAGPEVAVVVAAVRDWSLHCWTH